LSSKLNVKILGKENLSNPDEQLPGYLFTGITNHNLKPLFNNKGIKNFGYVFFEYELNDISLENAIRYDLIFTGSTWCKEKLARIGIVHTDNLIQGIDPELFYPEEENENQNLFVIFSGGKFEYRKGQDLVLKAIKILQEKYSDIILINSWFNYWPELMASMRFSKHIKYNQNGKTWKEFMSNIYQINGIDESKVFTFPIIPNNKLRNLYLKSDIGLFPNRCEGGTNLVMMEYMACGKPVIASFNSGNKDILNENNSLRLMEMKECKIYDESNSLVADWSEPVIEEIIDKIEFAYHNREKVKAIGRSAAEEMKNFTWAKTADKVIETIYKKSIVHLSKET